MVSVSEFQNDYEFYEQTPTEDLDLSFLETIESSENVFGMNETFFETLETLKPQRQLVPSLHASTFEESVEHAVWSSSWPKSNKHFPA